MKIKTPHLYYREHREHPDTNTLKSTCDAVFNSYQSAGVASVITFINARIGVWWVFFFPSKIFYD